LRRTIRVIHFTVSGVTQDFDYNTVSGAPIERLIWNGVFSLTANIDGSGHLVSGNFTISSADNVISNKDATFTGQTPISGPVLTGNLTAFGSTTAGTGGGIFEFRFNVTGGAVAPAFGPTGGMIISSSSGTFAGLFTSNFATSSDSGQGDTFATAAPSPQVFQAGFVLFTAVLGARHRPRFRRA